MDIPQRRLHKPSGNDRCRMNGREYWFGKHGSPESDQRYEAWVKSLLAGNRDPSPRISPTTMTGLVHRFLDNAKRKYSKGEYCNLKQAAKVLLARHRKTHPNHFGPVALSEVRDAMVADGWPRVRINEQVGRLRRLFRWAVSQELVHVNVSTALATLLPLREGETTAPETEPIRPASQTQIDALLGQLMPTLATMVRVHALVGMRPTDLFIMRSGDIDQTDDIWVYRPSSHKTKYLGKPLAYALGPQVQVLIKPFMDRGADEYLFSPTQTVLERRAARKAARTSKPSPSHLAKLAKTKPPSVAARYNRTSYRNALARAVRRISNGDADVFKALYFAPNQLRHTKATRVRADHGIEAARVALGHSHIDTTLIYAESDLRKAKEIAREHG